MVEKPNTLLNEIYRTGGGAIADTVDGLTGLGAAGVNLLLRGSPVQGTSFGPQVPQPWATGNKILRSAIPFATPGTFGGSASGVVRSVPPVLRSAPAVVKEAQAMVKKASSGPTRREILSVQDVIGKYGTPGQPPAQATFVSTPVNRRQVTKGLAATAAATAAVAPITAKLAEAIPAAKAAAPKVVKAAVPWQRVRSLLDKVVEGNEPGIYEPANTTMKVLHQTHERLAKTDPRHKAAAEAWAKVRELEKRIIDDDLDYPESLDDDYLDMKRGNAVSDAAYEDYAQAFSHAYKITDELFPIPKDYVVTPPPKIFRPVGQKRSMAMAEGVATDLQKQIDAWRGYRRVAEAQGNKKAMAQADRVIKNAQEDIIKVLNSWE